MSTIKVDTYLTRGGASEIAIDKLKGVTAAGSMLVVGEGGTNTTNLQQGLAKCWAQIEGDITSYRDSFNTSSLTDISAGRPRVTYTNNMANDDASLTMSHQNTTAAGTGSYLTNVGARNTAYHEHNHYQNGSLIDASAYNGTLHGDLA